MDTNPAQTAGKALNVALYNMYKAHEVLNALNKLFTRIAVLDNGRRCIAYTCSNSITLYCEQGNALELLIALYELEIACLIESSICTIPAFKAA